MPSPGAFRTAKEVARQFTRLPVRFSVHLVFEKDTGQHLVRARAWSIPVVIYDLMLLPIFKAVHPAWPSDEVAGRDHGAKSSVQVFGGLIRIDKMC